MKRDIRGGPCDGKRMDVDDDLKSFLVPVLYFGVRRFFALYVYSDSLRAFDFVKFCHASGREFKFKPIEKRRINKTNKQEARLKLLSDARKFFR